MSEDKGASTPPAHSGQRAERLMAAELAKHLGARYRDYKLIGSGGYATVWRALDSVNNQFVAIKRFSPHPDLNSRFFRELSNLYRVKGPNVSEILNLQSGEDQQPYIILEYCRGGNLRQFLQQRFKSREFVSEHEVYTMVKQIAVGLTAAHDKGIVHRDLKPENILIYHSRQERPCYPLIKLTDFGLSEFLQTSDEPAAFSDRSGTPAYMAPEQFTGRCELSSDVYSLGVVAFELLHGTLPFTGTSQEIARGHFYSEPEINSELSNCWQVMLVKLLEKSTESRFANARELLEALNGMDESSLSREPLAGHIAVDSWRLSTSLTNHSAAIPSPSPSPIPENEQMYRIEPFATRSVRADVQLTALLRRGDSYRPVVATDSHLYEWTRSVGSAATMTPLDQLTSLSCNGLQVFSVAQTGTVREYLAGFRWKTIILPWLDSLLDEQQLIEIHKHPISESWFLATEHEFIIVDNREGSILFRCPRSESETTLIRAVGFYGWVVCESSQSGSLLRFIGGVERQFGLRKMDVTEFSFKGVVESLQELSDTHIACFLNGGEQDSGIWALDLKSVEKKRLGVELQWRLLGGSCQVNQPRTIGLSEQGDVYEVELNVLRRIGSIGDALTGVQSLVANRFRVFVVSCPGGRTVLHEFSLSRF